MSSFSGSKPGSCLWGRWGGVYTAQTGVALTLPPFGNDPGSVTTTLFWRSCKADICINDQLDEK